MTRIGLVLDDAALAIADEAGVLSVEPSIVDAGRERPEAAGQPAAGLSRTSPAGISSRHWFDLARGRPPARDSLAIARAELIVRLAGAMPTAAVVAAGAAFDTPALARVLALLQAVPLPVACFVDAAALVTAALDLPDGTVMVLETGLHHLAVTRVDLRGGEARRRAARVRSAQGGLIALQDSWLQLVSEAMVLKTRFDPLHDAANEQRLYDALPAVAAQAAREGSATIGLEGTRHEVLLSRDQFAARGEAMYGDLVAMIHELRPAGASVTLVLPAALPALPGLQEKLAVELAGCRLLQVPMGFVALAAARFAGAVATDVAAAGAAIPAGVTDAGPAFGSALRTSAVPFKRRIPRFNETVVVPGSETTLQFLGSDPQAHDESPTHLLWAGRALPLTAASIEIGREAAAGGVRLGEGLAGVSRLHCTVRAEAGEIVLIDHSRYGSFVNGERVARRARLRAGDRLRIGDPGVELALISVGTGHGTPQG